MLQRIAFAICGCASLALIVATSTAVSAQEASVVTSPAITAAAAPEQVRFISFDKITHIRLEVFSSAGERLFDSGFKSGDLLDWSLRDQQGQRLTDGSYLCVVTVKDLSGRFSQRHSLVSLRERQVSLQRVAPEQLPADETRAWADSRATQALGAAQESGDISFIDADAPATMTVVAHDGENGQVTSTKGSLTFRTGDTLSGNDREQMRLTPEGRVGIGTTDPQATLDVAGAVRAQGGIVFGDGTMLKSARDLRNTDIVGVTSNATIGTPTLNVSGSGTQNKIAKWLDGAGTLGDSVITELNGNIGIGTANPASLLHLSGPGGVSAITLDTPGSQKFRFQTVPAIPNWGALTLNAKYNGGWYLDDTTTNGWFFKLDTRDGNGAGDANGLWLWRVPNGANPHTNEYPVFGVTNGRAFFLDNVGINTTSPTQKLEVNGNIKISGAGNGLMFPDGSVQTTAGGGGGVSGSGTTGMLPLWSGPTALSNSVITQANNNIGVGTATPTERLHVEGNVWLSGPGAIITVNNTDSSSNPNLYLRDASGAGKAGRISTNGGDIELAPSNLPKMVVLNSGNVGVGVTNPASKLTVAGVIESTSGGIKFPDGTVQTTSTLQGPAGPQGPKGDKGDKGDTGATGPQGPAVHTSAVCVDAIAVGGFCQARTCTCPNGTVSSVISPCTVTADTGFCSAFSCTAQQGTSNANGQCCVCRP